MDMVVWLIYPLVMTFAGCELEAMAQSIVGFPLKNGDIPVRYVKLPEGI